MTARPTADGVRSRRDLEGIHPMHDDRQLTEDRISRSVTERVRPALHRHARALDIAAWRVGGEPVPFRVAAAASYGAFVVGDSWGAAWDTTWFRLEGTIPSEWAGECVEAVVDLGFDPRRPGFQAEGLAYRHDGTPMKGLSPRNHSLPLRDVEAGDSVTVYVEAASNPEIFSWDPTGRETRYNPTWRGDVLTVGHEELYRFGQADLVVVDQDVWDLLMDIDVLTGLMYELQVTDPRRHEVLRALERAVDVLDAAWDVAAAARAARDQLAGVLSAPAATSAHTLSAIGHAHIDSAWLWPLRETKRKVARTFSNVVELQEDYPAFVFAASQAQQYSWVKEQQPYVYERIRAAIAAGRWAPVGGMWVESDANLPGGEALARQLVYGQRFFLDEFGVECKEVWLPDSFGYTAAFPQLARLAGAQWFLTQKLSWNDTNRFPHSTFLWEGIDGTRIFTHFPPVDTYNSDLSGVEVARAVANNTDLGYATRSLVPYGYGDGGGGPTREMIERAQRMADLEGAPRIVTESPSDFFRAAEAEYTDPPVWSGELYLELHRGTYTSQAQMKAGNRRSEHLLREAELWAATASLMAGTQYPYEQLEQIWKTVLLLQFHDILPGSSIAQVHREARDTYASLSEELEAIIFGAARAIGGGAALVLNAAPFDRDEVVVLDASAPVVAGGQCLHDGRVAVRVQVPGSSAAPLQPATVEDRVEVDGRVLRNASVEVVVDDDGLLASVMDQRTGRELLPPGARAGLLQAHPDRPTRWDAWDLDEHHQHHHVDLDSATSVEVIDRGPLVGAIRVTRSFRSSRVVQEVRLCSGSPRVELVTEVDWHEDHTVLKLALPVDVHADHVTSEIQFGHVERPTHVNTSWDAAKYERWSHRWIHAGEPGYGVAVVSDAVYGHDASTRPRDGGGRSTMVRLTLLRGPRFPDPTTDEGLHRFVVGVVPGADLAAASDHGRAVNLPLRVVPGTGDRAWPPPPPIVVAEGPGLAIELVKLADDRSGDLVIRAYERSGGRCQGTIELPIGPVEVHTCDLLERSEGSLVIVDRRVELDLRAFEIVTLRVRGYGSIER